MADDSTPDIQRHQLKIMDKREKHNALSYKDGEQQIKNKDE